MTHALHASGALSLLVLAAFTRSTLAAPVPALPAYYVLDESGQLTSPQIKALETILIEHTQATGEQILVGIFKSLDGHRLDDTEVEQRTHEIFEDWLANRGQDEGTLLAVYDTEKNARVESGYGMETLDETQDHAIVHRDLLPELKAGHLFRALGLGILDILRAEASPLIESGRAEQLLELGGIEDRMMAPTPHPFGPGIWFVFVLAGLVFFGGVLNNLLAAEAHFTREGWYHPNPWKVWFQPLLRLPRRGSPVQTGGTDGRW